MNINLTVYIIECLAVTLVFTCAIIIPLCRNPVWWIHDYPKDIQEKYFETHERIPAAPLSAPAVIKKLFALLLALVLLTLLVCAAGARDFRTAFWLSYGMWSLVNWYDCFFLDWVLFANIKKIRLPGTEHMDSAYHQKKYHFVHSLVGSVLGLAPCLVCAALVHVLYK